MSTATSDVARRWSAIAPWSLVGLLAGAGVLHFVAPRFFDDLIPPFLPAPRAWVYGSGVLELACAAALAHPRTRRRGALVTAVLFVVVFPGNIQSALAADSTLTRVISYLRLPLQVPLVLWALGIRRRAR